MNVFNILGPVMIGPSSSHTAGACRIGLITNKLLNCNNDDIINIRIFLHGSFAKTYKGHGTDIALVAGILGMKPDNNELKKSLNIASDNNINISFEEINLDDAHPNTAIIEVDSIDHSIFVQGSSIGGGCISITKINGMDVKLTGCSHTLIIDHLDKPGMIAAVTSILTKEQANISNFRLSRIKKGDRAIMTIELDGNITEGAVNEIQKLPSVHCVTLLKPL